MGNEGRAAGASIASELPGRTAGAGATKGADAPARPSAASQNQADLTVQIAAVLAVSSVMSIAMAWHTRHPDQVFELPFAAAVSLLILSIIVTSLRLGRAARTEAGLRRRLERAERLVESRQQELANAGTASRAGQNPES